MQTRKTITIITSPPTNTRSLPSLGTLTSPTTKTGPGVYRVEERSRTIYVASDVDPTQWDTHSLNSIFTLSEVSENGTGYEEQSIRRSHSSVTSPRVSVYQPRKPGINSAGATFPPTSASLRPPSIKTSSSRNRVLFYHKDDPHYGFTNFSAHPVIYNGKRYPTSEHLFQSFKFQEHRPNLAEHIRTCSERPSVAFSEARRFQPEVRPDWKHVNIQKMDETLFHKFTQHPDLQAELLATGDSELVEDSDKDAFWGIGADKKGRNELGKSLERLRSKLRGSGY